MTAPRWMCHDSECLTESAFNEGPHDYHEPECRHPNVRLKGDMDWLYGKWDEARYEQALAREKRLEAQLAQLREAVLAMQWSFANGETHTAPLRLLADVIVAWVNANGGEARYVDDPWGLPEPLVHAIAVRTRDGWAYCSPGQWVVKGEWFVTNPSAPIVQRDRLREFTVESR